MNLNCRFRDAKSIQNPVPAACVITVFDKVIEKEVGIFKIFLHTENRI